MLQVRIEEIIGVVHRDIRHKTIRVPINDPEVEAEWVDVEVELRTPRVEVSYEVLSNQDLRSGDIYRDSIGYTWYVLGRRRLKSEFGKPFHRLSADDVLTFALIASTFTE